MYTHLQGWLSALLPPLTSPLLPVVACTHCWTLACRCPAQLVTAHPHVVCYALLGCRGVGLAGREGCGRHGPVEWRGAAGWGWLDGQGCSRGSPLPAAASSLLLMAPLTPCSPSGAMPMGCHSHTCVPVQVTPTCPSTSTLATWLTKWHPLADYISQPCGFVEVQVGMW